MSNTLQDELRKVFAKARIPSSPALAARILELADDPNSTTEQFANLIEMDPALAARLLSMCNSAAFAQRHEVTTIRRAVGLLGISRVRTVSLGFQLVGHLGRLGGCPFDMKRFWQQSLLRACLGREFAIALVPCCADQAFLIGLLQDCGILVLVQLLGKPYAEFCQSDGLSPAAFFAAEHERFRYDHARVGGALAREWKLPEILAYQLENHHTEVSLPGTSTDLDRLSAITYLVGSLRLTAGLNTDESESTLAWYAKHELGMDHDDMRHCLRNAAEAYAQTARLLKDTVPDDLDVADLLSQANAQLTMSVESEVHRSAAEQETLKSALGEYRELAARDPLTGIFNRGALTEAARTCLQGARGEGESITLLFLDIDDFKQLNDTLGHQAGDDVLKSVALALKDCVPNAGVAARYGGEEFVLLVSGLTLDDARSFSEHVLARVREAECPRIDLSRPVTCSLGAVWGTINADTTIENLITAADELMYQAKRSGKNCCCFRRLGEVYDVDLLDSNSDTSKACSAAIRESMADRKHKRAVPKEFRRIAKMLDRGAPKKLLDMRKSIRKHMLAPCTFTTLNGAALEFESEDAYVRNISTGGIGLLTTRPIIRGQPAEIAVHASDGPRIYVAGIVAFCRHVEGAVHEVGVQLFTHSKQPILSRDPISAIRNLDWIAGALAAVRPAVGASA